MADISTNALVKVNMNSNTLVKFEKEETISMDVIMRICKELKCNIRVVMEIYDEKRQVSAI